jgi:hypothetical protein
MTEQEMQQLQQEIVEMCDAMIAKYDWDGAFSKYLESQ